ncbi:hypothetical protein IW261DRAFT_1417658 [Armillaria novae-zelandiae]|uniref:Uncharacterized protein n=1 Tax=Armillaria novae-zelandiae TaxID=153914 RepID=A0AA39UIC0_9AGAR|nr:hypothetical protein IW261DRAFT_1417658 [Armillaria novae-zelandiae]
MDTLTTYALDALPLHLPTHIASLASLTVIHLVVAAHEPYLLPRHVRARWDEERGITGPGIDQVLVQNFTHVESQISDTNDPLCLILSMGVLSTVRTSFRLPVQREADDDGTSFPQEDEQTCIVDLSHDSPRCTKEAHHVLDIPGLGDDDFGKGLWEFYEMCKKMEPMVLKDAEEVQEVHQLRRIFPAPYAVNMRILPYTSIWHLVHACTNLRHSISLQNFSSTRFGPATDLGGCMGFLYGKLMQGVSFLKSALGLAETIDAVIVLDYSGICELRKVGNDDPRGKESAFRQNNVRVSYVPMPPMLWMIATRSWPAVTRDLSSTSSALLASHAFFPDTYRKMGQRARNNWWFRLWHAFIVLALGCLNLEGLDRDCAFGWEEDWGWFYYFVWDTVSALANFLNIDVEGMFDSLEIKVLEELSKRKNGTELAGQNWRIERHVVDDAVMSNKVAEQSKSHIHVRTECPGYRQLPVPKPPVSASSLLASTARFPAALVTWLQLSGDVYLAFAISNPEPFLQFFIC